MNPHTRLIRAGRLLLALIMLASIASACVGDRGGTLQGSLQGFYTTDYELVRARLYSSELAIEYVREDGEVPVRVVLQRDENLTNNKTYTLPESGTITGVSRDSSIPPLESGTVTLTRYTLEEGARISGSFSGRFSLGRGQSASLTGRFDTTLEIISAVPGYTVDLGADADMSDSDQDEEMSGEE